MPCETFQLSKPLDFQSFGRGRRVDQGSDQSRFDPQSSICWLRCETYVVKSSLSLPGKYLMDYSTRQTSQSKNFQRRR